MGKPAPEKTERNNKIFKLKRQGLTFRALGAQFKITPDRVKIIYYRELKKRGLKPREYKRKIESDDSPKFDKPNN